MNQNGLLKIKESDRPSQQTVMAYLFLVNEDNLKRVLTKMEKTRKPLMKKWARRFCVDEGEFTWRGSAAVDWDQVVDGLFVSLLIIAEAAEAENDES